MYRVIVPFIDAVTGKQYKPGDKYEGKKERLAELASDKNAAGVPLIEEVKKPAK